MRKLLIFLLACVMLLPGAAFALTAGMEVDMEAGTIRFDSPASVGIHSTLPLPDGTLLLAVTEGDALVSGPVGPADETFSEAARRVTLFRLSPEGQVLWKQSLGEAEGSITLGLLCEAADGTVLTLVQHSVEQVLQYMQLQRFSIQDGSLAWHGEKIEPNADIREYVMPVEGGYLWETIHDAGATTTPRYYGLYARDDTQRWQVDDAQVGTPNQALTVPGGTLLFGAEWVDTLGNSRACAVLVDDEGEVTWKVDYEELGGSFFLDGAVSPSGQVAVIAKVTGADGSDEYALCTLDTGSGELHRQAKLAGMSGQYAELASRGGGWVIGRASGYGEANPPFIRFMEIDAQGNTVGTRELPYAAEQLLTPRLFSWKGELWADIAVHRNDGGQSALLRRID